MDASVSPRRTVYMVPSAGSSVGVALGEDVASADASPDEVSRGDSEADAGALATSVGVADAAGAAHAERTTSKVRSPGSQAERAIG